MNAAAFSQLDTLNGVTENVMLGQLGRFGSGFVDLLLVIIAYYHHYYCGGVYYPTISIIVVVMVVDVDVESMIVESFVSSSRGFSHCYNRFTNVYHCHQDDSKLAASMDLLGLSQSRG